MSHFESRQSNNKEVKTAPSQKTGFGAVLMRERKAKGLTHLQVSEKTRIRPSTLKALENEQWELLPQPVFVKDLFVLMREPLVLKRKRSYRFIRKPHQRNQSFQGLLLNPIK